MISIGLRLFSVNQIQSEDSTMDFEGIMTGQTSVKCS